MEQHDHEGQDECERLATLWSDFLRGERAEARALSLHVASCSRCAVELEWLRSQFQEWKTVKGTADLHRVWRKVEVAIAASPLRRSDRSGAWKSLLEAGLLATSALLLAAMLLISDAPFARMVGDSLGHQSVLHRLTLIEWNGVSLFLPMTYAAFCGVLALVAMPLLVQATRARRPGTAACSSSAEAQWAVLGDA